MKIIILLFLLFSFLGCKIGEQYSYGYVVKNTMTQDLKSPEKFYSYKNFLVEIINRSVSTMNINGSKEEVLNTAKLECVYILDINKTSIYVYDSFALNAKFKEKIMYSQKRGLSMDTLDEFAKRIYQSKQFKDTILNNEKLKFYDISFNFEDMNLKSYFFLQQKKFNTLFEVLNKGIQKKIEPFGFYGISSYSNNKEIISIKIDSIKKLNKEEINIFEKIISDAQSRGMSE